MKIYLINLDRRPDRLEFMTSQLNKLGLTFERVAAIDGGNDDDIGFPNDHPRLAKQEFACYLSHITCWEKLLDSGEERCLILEDDVILSPDLPEIITRQKLFKHKFGATRLETQRQKIWVKRDPLRIDGAYKLLESKTYYGGTAAYVMSRDFAQKLLRHHKYPAIPVDDLVFNYNRNIWGEYRIMQVTPAPAIQLLRHNPRGRGYVIDSDIYDARLENKPVALSVKKEKASEFNRHLRSVADELKLFRHKFVLVPFDREPFE